MEAKSPHRPAASNPRLLLGGTVLIVLVAVSIIGPAMVHYGPNETDVAHRLMRPSAEHLLGTDGFGRDILSRMVFGSRYSLLVGFLTMFATVIVGGGIGLIAGYLRGTADLVIMRVMEALMAFPSMLLAIALVAILGNRFSNLIIALTIAYVPRLARIVRSLVISIREELYVESARAIGARPSRIIGRYILPQLLPAMLVQASFIVAYAVIVEAGLSFLGIGIQPPAQSWGGMLSDGRAYLTIAPWMTIFPGAAIMLVVLSLNQFGDGLRDAFDPRLRRIA